MAMPPTLKQQFCQEIMSINYLNPSVHHGTGLQHGEFVSLLNKKTLK
jgi:hypothetical protein